MFMLRRNTLRCKSGRTRLHLGHTDGVVPAVMPRRKKNPMNTTFDDVFANAAQIAVLFVSAVGVLLALSTVF
jgi:hypothetical protein